MPTLHVRNVPEELYKRLHELAEKDNRSLTAEVIALLESAVKQRESREGTAEVLERSQQRSQKIKLPTGWVDSVDLIREDRNR